MSGVFDHHRYYAYTYAFTVRCVLVLSFFIMQNPLEKLN